jgi:hypothetical protein
MDEFRLEESRMVESDIKTKDRQDRMQTLPAEHLEQRWGTVRLFGDEQPLEGSNVTCLESRRGMSMETLKTVA